MTNATPTHWRDLFSLERLANGSAASHPLGDRVPLGLYTTPSAAAGSAESYRWATVCRLWSDIDQALEMNGQDPICRIYLDRLIARSHQRGAALSSPGPAGVWAVVVWPITRDEPDDNDTLGVAVVLRPARRSPDDLADTVKAHTGVSLSQAQTDRAIEQVNAASAAAHSVLEMTEQWAGRVGQLWTAELVLSGSSVSALEQPRPVRHRLNAPELSAINHEVRAPLATLRGVAATLRSEPEMSQEERHDFLAILEREAIRVGTVVDDALVAVRLGVENSDLGTQPVQLPLEIANQVSALLQQNEALNPVIEQHGERDIWVLADPRFTGPLVRNLLTNMFDFIDKDGAITATCQAVRDGTVNFSVIGHGSRVSVTETRAALQHFERKRRTPRPVVGVGLGLLVAQTIVDAHGWALEVSRVEPDELCIAVSMPIGSHSGEI